MIRWLLRVVVTLVILAVVFVVAAVLLKALAVPSPMTAAHFAGVATSSW